MITHIRFARHPSALLTSYRTEHFDSLYPDAWQKSDCEAICLKGFSGIEAYQDARTNYIVKILLFTNTNPQQVLLLDSKLPEAKSDDESLQSTSIWGALKNTLWSSTDASRSNIISGKIVPSSLAQYSPDLKLVRRVRLNRGNVMTALSVSSRAAPFLHHIDVAFHRDPSLPQTASSPSPSFSSSVAYAPLTQGGPSLFASSNNVSIYGRSNTRNPNTDADDLTMRDMYWMGAIACIVLFSGYLLNRCSNSKSYDEYS